MRFLALGGVAGPVLFVSLIILCGALRPGYSHVTQFISELGETGGSRAPLMNLLGFIPTGLLLAAFGVSLAYRFPWTSLSLAAAILIVAYGLGITGAGLYSCDPGCPSQHLSFEGMMHRVVSISAFLAGILGIALWGRCFRSLATWRSLSRYSAVSSAMALVFLLLVGVTEQSRVLTGVWQRLSMVTMDLWCAIVGLRVFRSGTGGVSTP